MQQVAATNSDIASPGIHASNTTKQSTEGMGDEFAQFLNNNQKNSGSDFRGHDNKNTSAAKASATQGAEPKQPHEVQPEKQENVTEKSDLESAGTANAGTSPLLQKGETQTTSEGSTAEGELEGAEPQLSGGEGDADTESFSHEDPNHDQWISILQKLNGESESQPDVIVETDDDANLQHTVASDDPKQPILEGDTQQEQVEPVSNLEIWKQELRDKILNASGGELNIHQQKNMEKTLSSLSEEEIQQLLTDHQGLRNMVGSILNTEEPDPQDLALLLALAEQNNDELYNTVSITDLINEQSEINTVQLDEEGLATEAENAEGQVEGHVEGNPTDSGAANTQVDTQEGTTPGDVGNEELDELVATETANGETVDIPDALYNDISIDDVTLDVREGEGEFPNPLPDPEVDVQVTSPGVDVTGKTQTANVQTANTTIPEDSPKKADALSLKQLLNDLEQSLQSTEDKVIAMENVTRRIESADVGKTPAGMKFLESLKNTLQEYKSQLKDGHEPAINLNKMMTDAMVADSAQVDAIALENQMKQALQQMVNVAQAHQNLDSGARESLLSAVQSSISTSQVSRENSASQVEAVKTQQAQQQTQVMEKAVNIMKPESAQDLANKVQVMMNQRNMVADIRLDPPDLGQMQIKITLQGDTASVSMVVQSQAAREALEQNQPKLKELLEQQGIELGQSSVQEDGRGEAGQRENGEVASGRAGGDSEDVESIDSADKYVAVDAPERIDYFA